MGGLAAAQAQSPAVKFVRFRKGGQTAHGILDGDAIREIRGGLFDSRQESGAKHALKDVKLLYPVEPTKILALAGNYRSHLGQQPAHPYPEIFYKPVSALQNPEDPILIPKDATDVHYEGELVLVIGKRARNLSVAEAREAIFGVTCGNDVSERQWQNGKNKDVQWWRAKGADTFAPVGPVIARGLDYGRLAIQTRLNGKVVQKDSTSSLVHDGPATVSFVSRYLTLMPGDLIFTGTSGTTTRMVPGDVVEVEIEGIGVLRNKVAAA
ncbi:MAG: fumarylacetoacetate hydrolase family protein [Candidatus Solibacter usitatus]|nr:fumarylacetoacetate hydrolase family protein [Candidatus Solibacter usitatus]